MNLQLTFSSLVVFVTDLFHPVGCLAVEVFLNGHMRQIRGWRGTVPMFLPRCEPDHITWSNVFDGTTPALDPTTASRHDQGLAQRMAVPCGPSAGLEGGTGTAHACWIGGLEQGSIRTVPVKYSAGPFPEGCEPLLYSSVLIPLRSDHDLHSC